MHASSNCNIITLLLPETNKPVCIYLYTYERETNETLMEDKASLNALLNLALLALAVAAWESREAKPRRAARGIARAQASVSRIDTSQARAEARTTTRLREPRMDTGTAVGRAGGERLHRARSQASRS